MRSLTAVTVSSLLMIGLAHAGGLTAKQRAIPVARGEGFSATLGDFADFLNELRPSERAAHRSPKGKFALLHRLLREEAMYREAVAQGFGEAPSVKALERDGHGPRVLKRQAIALLLKKVLRPFLEKVSGVGEEQVRAHYEKNRGRYRAGTTFEELKDGIFAKLTRPSRPKALAQYGHTISEKYKGMMNPGGLRLIHIAPNGEWSVKAR